MRDLKIILLEILSKMENELSYYQLDRKLTNRNMHNLIQDAIGEAIDLPLDLTPVPNSYFDQLEKELNK